jgi:hypothetical protein
LDNFYYIPPYHQNVIVKCKIFEWVLQVSIEGVVVSGPPIAESFIGRQLDDVIEYANSFGKLKVTSSGPIPDNPAPAQ